MGVEQCSCNCIPTGVSRLQQWEFVFPFFFMLVHQTSVAQKAERDPLWRSGCNGTRRSSGDENDRMCLCACSLMGREATEKRCPLE